MKFIFLYPLFSFSSLLALFLHLSLSLSPIGSHTDIHRHRHTHTHSLCVCELESWSLSRSLSLPLSEAHTHKFTQTSGRSDDDRASKQKPTHSGLQRDSCVIFALEIAHTHPGRTTCSRGFGRMLCWLLPAIRSDLFVLHSNVPNRTHIFLIRHKSTCNWCAFERAPRSYAFERSRAGISPALSRVGPKNSLH